MHGVTSTTYTAETLRKIVPSTFKPQQNTVTVIDFGSGTLHMACAFFGKPYGRKVVCFTSEETSVAYDLVMQLFIPT